VGRSLTGALVLLLIVGGWGPHRPTSPIPVSVCDLSRDSSSCAGKLIALRGVSYSGLRQECPQECATAPWPSRVWVVGADPTYEASWTALDQAEQMAKREAGRGRHPEIWVTAVGRLRTQARHSPAGPCDVIGSRLYGYGHLGEWLAQREVDYFTGIEAIENPNSPYDYGRVRRGTSQFTRPPGERGRSRADDRLRAQETTCHLRRPLLLPREARPRPRRSARPSMCIRTPPESDH